MDFKTAAFRLSMDMAIPGRCSTLVRSSIPNDLTVCAPTLHLQCEPILAFLGNEWIPSVGWLSEETGAQLTSGRIRCTLAAPPHGTLLLITVWYCTRVHR